MFDYGFIIPLKNEAQPLLKLLINKKTIQNGTHTIYVGTLQDKKVSLIISGCGKIKSAASTQYLIDTYAAKMYFHYGSAGAISAKLRIGDTIIAEQVIEHDSKELFPQITPPPIHKISTEQLKVRLKKYKSTSLVWGSILSGDEDIVSTKRKKELYKLHKGLSVDWESAGFALTCQLNKVEGYIFRGISDYAYEHTAIEYGKNQELVMNNIIRLLIYLLKEKNAS